VDVTDASGLTLVARPVRENGVLERDLEDHKAGDPRRLHKEPQRILHVLEHVGENRDVVGMVFRRDAVAVEPTDIDDGREAALPRQVDARLRDLIAREAPAEPSVMELLEHRTIAASDISDGPHLDVAQDPPGAVRLLACPEPSPLSETGVASVGLVVLGRNIVDGVGHAQGGLWRLRRYFRPSRRVSTLVCTPKWWRKRSL